MWSVVGLHWVGVTPAKRSVLTERGREQIQRCGPFDSHTVSGTSLYLDSPASHGGDGSIGGHCFR